MSKWWWLSKDIPIFLKLIIDCQSWRMMGERDESFGAKYCCKLLYKFSLIFKQNPFDNYRQRSPVVMMCCNWFRSGWSIQSIRVVPQKLSCTCSPLSSVLAVIRYCLSLASLLMWQLVIGPIGCKNSVQRRMCWSCFWRRERIFSVILNTWSTWAR